MRTNRKSASGLSLVEVTIMLLVLMLLTGVLAPSIMDFVNDAKWVKAKEDCEAIGVSVARLTRDIGPCLKFNGDLGCTLDNRVDILMSDGPDVLQSDTEGDGAVPFESNSNIYMQLAWWKDDLRGDTMEDQFTINAPLYRTPGQKYTYTAVGPQYNLGWRGAYITGPIGPDPWGHRYLVNSVFLAVARQTSTETHDAYATTTPPVITYEGRYGWSHDTFCITPGPDGIFSTAFGGNSIGGTTRKGDDFVYIIQGDTR